MTSLTLILLTIRNVTGRKSTLTWRLMSVGQHRSKGCIPHYRGEWQASERSCQNQRKTHWGSCGKLQVGKAGTRVQEAAVSAQQVSREPPEGLRHVHLYTEWTSSVWVVWGGSDEPQDIAAPAGEVLSESATLLCTTALARWLSGGL